jgi:hypothetical protein
MLHRVKSIPFTNTIFPEEGFYSEVFEIVRSGLKTKPEVSSFSSTSSNQYTCHYSSHNHLFQTFSVKEIERTIAAHIKSERWLLSVGIQ